MKNCLLLGIVFLALGLAAQPAAAQLIDRPETTDTPLGPNVAGFFTIALGTIYAPTFNVTAEQSGTDLNTYKVRQANPIFPNYLGHAHLIPAFGDNGVDFEGSYDAIAMTWKQDVISNLDGDSTGKTTAVLTFGSGSVNYIRYFLSGADRIYLLAGAGYSSVKVRTVSSTGGEDKTTEASFNNGKFNSGFGYLHQMGYSAIGFELRADVPFLPTKVELGDAKGDYKATFTHPVLISLAATFSLGRLLDH